MVWHMKHYLDWSSYEAAGQGDAYAGIPAAGGDFARAVSVCIRDRLCERTPKGVMCPSFRATGDEAHTPGARVLALKAVLNGDMKAASFADPNLAEAMSLCVGCKGCKRECANQVDMAALKIEYQAQRNACSGISMRDRLFAGLPHWLRYRQTVRRLIALRNASATLAGLGERWLGISAKRRLPEPSLRAFSAPPPEQNENAGERDVMLFVDTFSMHFEPEIAHAAHRVLTAAGYRVSWLQPADGTSHALCCGRTYLSLGQVAQARQEALRLHAALQPACAAGIPIIGLEPSCILSLRDDHLKLGLGEGAERLAKQVYLLEEFIAREHDKKRFDVKFKALGRGRTLVHGHCHQKAVGAMKSLRKVLRLIPEFEFEFIEASCCGMAGSFGLEAEHADISMRMAQQDMLPALRAAPADATVLANGFSCRHQILDGASRKAVHVALLLSDALAEPSC